MGRVPRVFIRLAGVVPVIAALSFLAGPVWAQAKTGAVLPPEEDEESESASPASESESTPASESDSEAAPESAPARRSGAQTHDGFFMRAGLNVGLLMLTADAAQEVEYSGLQAGADLMFGVTPMPGLVVGGALVAARTNDPKVTLGDASYDLNGSLVFVGLAAFGNYYLDPREGLHLQAMAGYGGLTFETESGASTGNDPSGIFVGLGVGYDFWIGAEWSIGPFGRVIYGHMSTKSPDVTYRDLYPSVGAAVTFH